ncbi:MAG: SseB family protein [Mycobacterium sp.]|nr:SseB family protein [Mycobacterium sp.]
MLTHNVHVRGQYGGCATDAARRLVLVEVTMMAAWLPVNDVERAMADTLACADSRRYFQILADAALYLPIPASERPDPGIDDRLSQLFATCEFMGQEYLLAFTSLEALARHVTGFADGYTVTSYSELLNGWPTNGWWLAVNPGTPLEVYLPVEAVRDAAAGRLVVPTALELVNQADQVAVDVAPATIEAAIRDIVERMDVDGYLSALVRSRVAVPTTAAVGDADQILQPGFPWRVTDRDGTATVEVFTSAETLAAAVPASVSHVTVDFPAVLVAWPDSSYQLAIDPGSMEVTFSGEQVPMLLALAYQVVVADAGPGDPRGNQTNEQGND